MAGLPLLLVLLGLAAITLAACYYLLWLIARFVHPTVAAVVGASAVASLVYAVVAGLAFCDAPPVFVPPRPGSQGEGKMAFACDGPGGAAIYMGLFIVYPFIAICLAFITYRVWRSANKRRFAAPNGQDHE